LVPAVGHAAESWMVTSRRMSDNLCSTPARRNAAILSAMDLPGRAIQDVVLTIVGSDRPGLVEAVADAVARAGGNWLESRMAHLAGQFAGILRVQAPAEAIPRLVTAIEGLSQADLKVTVAHGTPATATGPQRSLELDIVGLDRPGIVRDISGVLARHAANIEELVTDSSSAPMSGELLFRAHIRLNAPPAVDLGRLRAELERFATDLMVEMRLVETVTGTRVRSPTGDNRRAKP
jgi:glycine cleavage system regulatory protein